MAGSGGQCRSEHGQDLSLAAALCAVGRAAGIGRSYDVVNGEGRPSRWGAGVRLDGGQRRAELRVKGLPQVGP